MAAESAGATCNAPLTLVVYAAASDTTGVAGSVALTVIVPSALVTEDTAVPPLAAGNCAEGTLPPPSRVGTPPGTPRVASGTYRLAAPATTPVGTSASKVVGLGVCGTCTLTW